MTADGGRVTITAIARAAGVSVPTVSRVVNGRGDVAPETRRRVEDLLQQHGYRRRPAAPARRAGLVDLVFNDLDSPWAVEILRGVEQVAHDASIGTVVSAVHSRASTAREWLLGVRARASDGVILVTSDIEPQVHSDLRRIAVPTVIIDPAGIPAVDVPTVGATNWAGGLAAAEHLLGLGHVRIGFVGGPRRLLCSRARLDGYRAALEAADVTVDDALVTEGTFYHESGFDAANTMLELRNPPTAVFAASDQMAFGVYEAVRRHGLRIPDDISVVGFDDLPESRWTSPPLTTVRQPLAEMGAHAARTLLRLIDGEVIDSPRLELATTLSVRESTGPPPRTR